MSEDQIVGCLLGTAVGDSLGLPYEGLTRGRGVRLIGTPDRQRFFFGRGMVSDDTEHTCMVAQALIESDGDVALFQHSLAKRLRWWLLGAPAGIGLATLKSIIRLWFGCSPDHSGVFSAGNGPAMRAAIIGVTYGDELTFRDLIRVATRLTHTDPKAEYGACAIGLAAAMAKNVDSVSPDSFLDRLRRTLPEEGAREFLDLMSGTVASVNSGQSTDAYAESLGLSRRVSGYMYHSVPVAIHVWLSNRLDYRAAMTSVIRCGGDTDSVAAFVGGIVGVSVGRKGIPDEWLSTIIEWPRTITWMSRLGRQLDAAMDTKSKSQPQGLPVIAVLARNLFFAIVVLYHGYRRLGPPY